MTEAERPRTLRRHVGRRAGDRERRLAHETLAALSPEAKAAAIELEAWLQDHDARHEEHAQRMDAQERLTKQLADDMHAIRNAIEAYNKSAPERAVLKHKVALMWGGYGIVLTAIVLYGVHRQLATLLPAPEVRLNQQQQAVEAILDIASDIAAEGRVRTGPKRGWPTVRALNARLRQDDPGHPRVDALDRDAACRPDPARCMP